MTSKRWRRTFGARLAKVVFSFSLLLACFSFAELDFGSLHRELEGTDTEAAVQILASHHQAGRFAADAELQQAVEAAIELRDRGNVDRVRGLIELRALAQGSGGGVGSGGASSAAREIKKHPIYQDPGMKQQTNWLAGAVRRLQQMKLDCRPECRPSCQPRCARGPATPALGSAGPWLSTATWFMVAVLAVLFAFFVLRHFAWVGTLRRRARALLDEEEPERTVDEWLQMADDLAARGKHREAVRCLYVACLLRLDEARVARFERSQTNWEHLARIDASPRRPADLDFREPTKAFDRIWYGMSQVTSEDVDRFRLWYSRVVESLKAVAA